MGFPTTFASLRTIVASVSYHKFRAAVAGCERLSFLVSYAWRAYRCIVVAGPLQLFGRILKRGSFRDRSNIGSSRSRAEESGTVRASGYRNRERLIVTFATATISESVQLPELLADYTVRRDRNSRLVPTARLVDESSSTGLRHRNCWVCHPGRGLQ